MDTPTIFFFLGILTAVSALQSAGHLDLLAKTLDGMNIADNQKIYVIDLIIGFLSAIVDNVPLVAGAIGMYDIAPAGSAGYEAFSWWMGNSGNSSHTQPEQVDPS